MIYLLIIIIGIIIGWFLKKKYYEKIYNCHNCDMCIKEDLGYTCINRSFYGKGGMTEKEINKFHCSDFINWRRGIGNE